MLCQWLLWILFVVRVLVQKKKEKKVRDVEMVVVVKRVILVSFLKKIVFSQLFDWEPSETNANFNHERLKWK